MSKPDWRDAPEWANYLAQDECGSWYWFEHEPIKMHARFEIDYSGGNQRSRAAMAVSYPNWQETLECRP